MTEKITKWVGVEEIARHLGVTPRYVSNAVKLYGMPHGRTSLKRNATLIFDPEAVDAWVIEQGQRYKKIHQ